MDAFRDVQIPDAVISLKQGVGRLIRDVYDYGAIKLALNSSASPRIMACEVQRKKQRPWFFKITGVSIVAKRFAV